MMICSEMCAGWVHVIMMVMMSPFEQKPTRDLKRDDEALRLLALQHARSYCLRGNAYRARNFPVA